MENKELYHITSVGETYNTNTPKQTNKEVSKYSNKDLVKKKQYIMPSKSELNIMHLEKRVAQLSNYILALERKLKEKEVI